MKRPAFLLAAVLFLTAAILMTYRILNLGYPVFPMAPGQTWQLEIEVTIEPGEGESQLSLGLPLNQKGKIVTEESISSGPYSFNLLSQGPNRVGIWSGTGKKESEELQYRATILSSPKRSIADQPPKEGGYHSVIPTEDQTVITILAGPWRKLKPATRIEKVLGFSREVWSNSFPATGPLAKLKDLEKRYGRMETILALLEAVNLMARPVEGLRLEEGVQTKPSHWIEVWTGKSWESINPETGYLYQNPDRLLPLAMGGMPGIRLSNVRLTNLRWILTRQVVRQWKLLFERIVRSNQFLNRWSLFHLPPNFQQTFRILLLVPVGALMISILRNIIGFPTFGIFMPVLMALSFRNTGLLYGICIFAGVLLVGYLVRRSLDKLHLLLVPRMSVLLTLVICCFTLIALMGNKFGLREFMSVGLIPFVILTMTIERFFVVIEEAGPRKAFITSLGSAAVSIIAYLVVDWEPLQLTFFVYPELMLAVAAIQVLIGRYAGYRLSEIFRFRSLRGPS